MTNISKNRRGLKIYKGRYIRESFAYLVEVTKKDGNRRYLGICESWGIGGFQSTKMWGQFLTLAVFQEHGIQVEPNVIC